MGLARKKFTEFKEHSGRIADAGLCRRCGDGHYERQRRPG
jgi:hypothetical protein